MSKRTEQNKSKINKIKLVLEYLNDLSKEVKISRAKLEKQRATKKQEG